MRTKEITPIDYARLMGCSLQNITKHIRKQNFKRLPNVIRIKRYSRFYVLEVPANLSGNSFKEIKRRK